MNRKHWMLILAGALLFVGVAVLLADPPYSHTVGTNSVMVLPPRTLQNAAAWTTNVVYSQGDIVLHGGKLFWCQTAAGATNTISDVPAYEADGRSNDGANTWQYIPSVPRKGFFVVNDDDSVTYLSFGVAAVLNSGARMNANGGSMDDFAGVYQGSIYAITSVTSNNVAIQEW